LGIPRAIRGFLISILLLPALIAPGCSASSGDGNQGTSGSDTSTQGGPDTGRSTFTSQEPPAAPKGLYATAQPDQVSILVGQTVTFDASAFGTAEGESLSWEWDFNFDGQNFVPDAEAQGSVAEHPFPEDGDFGVQIQVTRGSTEPITLEKPIHVNVSLPEDKLPVAIAEPRSITAFMGERVYFKASASHDTDTLGSNDLTYEWDWNFKDGAGFQADPQADGAEVFKVFMVPGDHFIQLQVTDDDGGEEGKKLLGEPLTVNVVKPSAPAELLVKRGSTLVAVATADKYAVQTGDEVTFSAEDSFYYDTGAAADIDKWEWNVDRDKIEGNAEAKHRFDAKGNYEVRLTVTDKNGNTDELGTPLTIEVSDPPAPVTVIISPPGAVTDTTSPPGAEPGDGFPWWILIVIVVVIGGAVVFIRWTSARKSVSKPAPRKEDKPVVVPAEPSREPAVPSTQEVVPVVEKREAPEVKPPPPPPRPVRPSGEEQAAGIYAKKIHEEILRLSGEIERKKRELDDLEEKFKKLQFSIERLIKKQQDSITETEQWRTDVQKQVTGTLDKGLTDLNTQFQRSFDTQVKGGMESLASQVIRQIGELEKSLRQEIRDRLGGGK